MKNQDKPKQPACTKVIFTTKEAAAKRLREIRAVSKETKKPIRWYKCRKCGFYHLTSMSAGEQQSAIFSGSIHHRAAKLAKEWIRKNGWNK